MSVEENIKKSLTKIAIFGGSFDPFHIGHEAIIDEALQELDIDKIFVVPTFLNPFKKRSFLDSQTRLESIKEVLKNKENIVVSSFEVDQDRAVASIETVEFLKKEYSPKKIYLIIGEDNLEKLHLWHKYEELKELVEFVVCTRNGYTSKQNYKYLNVNVDISSTNLRENLNLDFIPEKIHEKVKKHWKKD